MPMTVVADISQNMLDIYARVLLQKNLPNILFRQLVDYKMDETVEPGGYIKFPRLDNLPRGGMLTDEETPIPVHKMTGSEVRVAMNEFGNGTAFSRKAEAFSIRPMMDDAVNVLGRDYSLTMDAYLRDVFLSTANKYYAKADGSSGTSNNDISSGFTGDLLELVVEQAKNLNMPKLNRAGDTFYAFVGTPRQITQMRQSSKWLDARIYSNPSDILLGEAGRMEDVIFFDSTQMNEVKITSGAKTFSRGILIGANSVGYGESIPMEMRAEEPYDFGRKQAVAWYLIGGAGILNDYLIEVRTDDSL